MSTLFLQTAASAGVMGGDLFIVLATIVAAIVILFFIIIWPIVMIVRLYKAVMRTADATEESEALLRRMLKVQEAVAKREHPDLYASAASADASGADKTEPSEQQ